MYITDIFSWPQHTSKQTIHSMYTISGSFAWFRRPFYVKIIEAGAKKFLSQLNLHLGMAGPAPGTVY